MTHNLCLVLCCTVVSTQFACPTPLNHCFHAVKQDLATNDSLPLNTSITAGNNATFQCELGTYSDDISEFFIFQYRLASQGDNESAFVWHRECHIGTLLAGECWVNYEEEEGVYVLPLTILLNQEGLKIFRFTFNVLNVDMKHNSSVFSCSIFSGDQFQWLHSAYLHVEAVNVSLLETGVEGESLDNMEDLAIAVSVVMLFLVGVGALALTGGIMLARRKWRTKRVEVTRSDRGKFHAEKGLGRRHLDPFPPGPWN